MSRTISSQAARLSTDLPSVCKSSKNISLNKLDVPQNDVTNTHDVFSLPLLYFILHPSEDNNILSDIHESITCTAPLINEINHQMFRGSLQ